MTLSFLSFLVGAMKAPRALNIVIAVRVELFATVRATLRCHDDLRCFRRDCLKNGGHWLA